MKELLELMKEVGDIRNRHDQLTTEIFIREMWQLYKTWQLYNRAIELASRKEVPSIHSEATEKIPNAVAIQIVSNILSASLGKVSKKHLLAPSKIYDNLKAEIDQATIELAQALINTQEKGEMLQ